MKLTGNLINSYLICPRKAWLYAHEVNPYGDNVYLEIGALIGQESYKREKKEISLPGMKIDLVKKKDGDTVVAEIKKSSKGKDAARTQLLFYLYNLEKKGVNVKGELLFPKERKKEEVVLTDSKRKELEEILTRLEKLIQEDIPPLPVKIPFCRGCAYNEFCWAEV